MSDGSELDKAADSYADTLEDESSAFKAGARWLIEQAKDQSRFLPWKVDTPMEFVFISDLERLCGEEKR